VQVGERGQQRGGGEDRARQEVGGGLAGGGVGVVPAVVGQGACEPGVDVRLDVVAGAAGEQVAYGFVAFSGCCLRQGTELTQHLQLVGAGLDPRLLPQFGLACGGGRGVGGQFRTDDVVRARVVNRARAGCGEQL
jgi:hypothetical protein